jgi:adenosylcobyric acid synthase
VLGVVPHVPQLRIADEDSVALDSRKARQRPSRAELDIALVRLPQLSNYDDVLELEHEPGVTVRFVKEPAELRRSDLVIIPGSKSTLSDLSWLRRSGLSAQIARQAHAGGLVLGICGGCQMLGQWIEDPERLESREPLVPGLGLLDSSTRFAADKRTTQVEARCQLPCFLADEGPAGAPLRGYEIHMGRITLASTTRSPFRLLARNAQPVDEHDGAINAAGNVIGTMLHGLFANESLRRGLLRGLRLRRGLGEPSGTALPSREAEYDRLAAAVREALDLRLLRHLIGAA